MARVLEGVLRILFSVFPTAYVIIVMQAIYSPESKALDIVFINEPFSAWTNRRVC